MRTIKKTIKKVLTINTNNSKIISNKDCHCRFVDKICPICGRNRDKILLKICDLFLTKDAKN